MQESDTVVMHKKLDTLNEGTADKSEMLFLELRNNEPVVNVDALFEMPSTVGVGNCA